MLMDDPQPSQSINLTFTQIFLFQTRQKEDGSEREGGQERGGHYPSHLPLEGPQHPAEGSHRRQRVVRR